MENPWNIHSIYELQFYNCPCCIFKDPYKQEIINHACEFHPESVTFLQNIIDNSLEDVVCPWKDPFVDINMEIGFQGHIMNASEIQNSDYSQYLIKDSKEGIKNKEHKIMEEVQDELMNEPNYRVTQRKMCKFDCVSQAQKVSDWQF